MTCYIVPTIAALISTGVWKFRHTKKELLWLNLMMGGGAAFGIIDHLWNNELFLIGPNILNDLLLGFVITGVIFTAWLALVYASRLPSARALIQ